jgi:hypothetical protein
VIAPAAATAKAVPAAAKPAAANATAAAAAAPKAKPESAPLRKLLRALLQAAPKEEPAAAPAAEEEPAADAVEEPAADANATAPAEEETPASKDVEAIVEELPGGPKPMIEVMTSIQPLTEEEAQSVLGTTGSPYFIKIFKETLTATNLTLTEDIVTKIAEPAKEFEWPKPEVPEAEANLSECGKNVALL